MRAVTVMGTTNGREFTSTVLEVTEEEYAQAVETLKQILGSSVSQMSMETDSGHVVIPGDKIEYVLIVRA